MKEMLLQIQITISNPLEKHLMTLLFTNSRKKSWENWRREYFVFYWIQENYSQKDMKQMPPNYTIDFDNYHPCHASDYFIYKKKKYNEYVAFNDEQ